jgi:hypothetical protein
MAAGEPFSVVPCFVRVKQERTKRKMTPKPALRERSRQLVGPMPLAGF